MSRASREDGPASESIFRMNLDAFGGRAARLCTLLRLGRLTADSCFLAISQLWIQLARSQRELDEGTRAHDEQD
ncbi:MAG: hypothetical protein IPJ41_03325 [Phycisphaerales bacterium]|nr:hypothetical protein [Phycisphaerales bacterium]